MSKLSLIVFLVTIFLFHSSCSRLLQVAESIDQLSDDTHEADTEPINKILYWRKGRFRTIRPDGSGEKVLTDISKQYTPNRFRLSPDGNSVAFGWFNTKAAYRNQKLDLNPALYVRTLQGDKVGTDIGVFSWSHAWSPDGTELAFSRVIFRDNDTIDHIEHGVVNVTTRKITNLNLPVDHILTDWSRDGKLFLTANIKKLDGKLWRQLYLMNRDGTLHKRILDTKRSVSFGLLSPDSTQILGREIMESAANENDGLPFRLIVLDIGSGKIVLIDPPFSKTEIKGCCWSPNGKKIAYTWKDTDSRKNLDGNRISIESALVICDSDGKNIKTVISEKSQSPVEITIGGVDWR